jgi:heavy metal sensor kinase
LTLWYTAICAGLIILFGVVFYVTFRAGLASSLDSTLQLRTQQIAAGVSYDQGSLTIQDVTGELPGLATNGQGTDQSGGANGPGQTGQAPNVNFGALVRILNAQGKTIYISPAFQSLSIPPNSVAQPLTGASWQGTVTARDGQMVRLYSAPLGEDNHIFGVVQVGEPLAPFTNTLWHVVIGLLLLTPFVLVLGALGSYWLAGRAFRPIHRLISTAEEIEASDLQRRVSVPRANDEIQHLALTLNEMIARLDHAFAQQRRFVADASHELRTPVTVIRSLTDVALADVQTPEEYASVLGEVNAEAERLGHLVSDLLALARADEGQTALEREVVRLDRLAAEVAATLEPLAAEHAIALKVQPLEPVTVRGDEARLMQAVINLLENALSYTNTGGAVTLSVVADKAHAILIVRDTGIGIAPEHLPHLFERFYRADPARSRSPGGNGLGLAIVQWVIEAHGGTIAVKSQVGQGSTFTVFLPLALPNLPSHERLIRDTPQAAQSVPRQH